MPNPVIVPNPPQMPSSPQEYVKYLLKMRGYTVQRLCDETGLVKSTMDKWLAYQTQDTSYTNVQTAVKKLGGSLDYLAQIEAAAPDVSSVPSAHPPQEEKKINADDPALVLLVESHEKEIQREADLHRQALDRISSQQQVYLDRFRRLNEESRAIYLEQHKTAIDQLVKAYDKALFEQEKHLHSAIRGHNWWRGLSLVLIVALLLVFGYALFEFSSIESGITGYILRKHGIISMYGPGGV